METSVISKKEEIESLFAKSDQNTVTSFRSKAKSEKKKEEDDLGNPERKRSKTSVSTTTSVSTLDLSAYERDRWTNQLDFFISCVGFAVGLGNVWRFPFLCYASGGGAFLIPYTFFLFTCAIPLFFMEISLGQFASLSPITIWRISPLFKGLGYGMVIVSFLVCIYYNVIMAWNLYYLYKTMAKVLPWTLCDQSWNSPKCFSHDMNDTYIKSLGDDATAASEEFWDKNVLERTEGVEHLGSLRIELFVTLTICWICVFLCLIRGIKSSGKVVYVTALFPYVVLAVLLVRGITLPGALEGIKFYLLPDWKRLAEYKIWVKAATQIFYSVGMGWGSLITMSSYNVFNNNVKRDAILVPLINCATSVFAGFVIFSVLGYLAHKTGSPIKDVVAGGPGLAFVAYPQAVALMPGAHFWAFLFFLMIFTLGLDSQFGLFETVTSTFIDEFPTLLRRRKTTFTLIMCIVEYAFGIPLVTQGGAYLLTLIDHYCATFSLMLLSIFESFVITWIYGIDRFSKDIELMIGQKPNRIWQIMWKFITPAIVLFIWMSGVVGSGYPGYGSYKFPLWSIIGGWILGTMSAVAIPIGMVIVFVKHKRGTFLQKLRFLTQPSALWGPARDEDRDRFFQSMSTFDRDRYQAAHMNLDYNTFIKLRDTGDSAQDWDAWLKVLKKKEKGSGSSVRSDPRFSFIETSVNK